jgi:hypothetical protein
VEVCKWASERPASCPFSTTVWGQCRRMDTKWRAWPAPDRPLLADLKSTKADSVNWQPDFEPLDLPNWFELAKTPLIEIVELQEISNFALRTFV